MKSFHKIRNLSLMVLGLGMVCSAHAVASIVVITQENCDFPADNDFKQNETTFVLDQDITCSSDVSDFALKFEGSNNHILLNHHSITAEEDEEPGRGILITGDGNHVTGPGTVEGFGGGLDNDEGNIIINNGDNNHVSGLTLNRGGTGVSIITSGGATS